MTLPNPPLPPLNFDPRLVPVVAVDAHLPKVPIQSLQVGDLVRRFSSSHVWTPELLAEPSFSQRPAVHASVLVPLVQRDGGLTVLLTERTTHLSSHSGQVAFPGGKADPEDTDAIDTALREAEEEIGLERRFVQVLGTLPIYTTGSAFLVTPVVALVDAAHSVTANPHEVADVFEVPLSFLMDPANHRRHAVEWAGSRREWLSMPYIDATAERFIWGATAGMLRNFYRFLLS
jgi:8-oxo-dGTP pyrophosphatase MutT (NUDIX family)